MSGDSCGVGEEWTDNGRDLGGKKHRTFIKIPFLC